MHYVWCSMQSNQLDLTWFLKPTRIPFLNTCPVVSMQADNTLGNEYAQIKTCYPLLRGILHIMTKDWLSSAILRGLLIVIVGGYFYLFYVIFLYVRHPTSIDLGQGVLLAHWSKSTVWYMWVVKIFFAFHEGHSGLRMIRKIKRSINYRLNPKQ